jgi:hypothetical protein
VALNREIVGAPSTEKLVSVMAVDNSKYLHYRPTLQDGSGEFTISFFRQTATDVLGHDVLGVSALSAAEQEELLEEQVGKQLKVEVKANWYSPGSKYSFAGDITLLLHKCYAVGLKDQSHLAMLISTILRCPAKTVRDFD